MAQFKKYQKTGESAEDKALAKFGEIMTKKISEFEGNYEQPWFTIKGIMAQNMSGRCYNGTNQFFLLWYCEEKGFKTPIFGTFDQFKNLSFSDEGEILTDKDGNDLPVVSVRKGEGAFPVFITIYKMYNKETKEKISLGEYDNIPESEKENYKMVSNTFVHHVFNIDQTNMKEARPELYKKFLDKNKDKEMDKSKEYHWQQVDDMIKTQGWLCPIHLKKQNDAYYSPSKDEIILPTYKQFKDGEKFYGTAIHEIAHSTGHEDRLNRLQKGQKFGSPEYGREELVAEMTSALVCHKYGVTTGIAEENIAYLKGWLKNIKEDAQFIKTVLNDVKKASKMISDVIDTIQ